jgi:hypothetical protein
VKLAAYPSYNAEPRPGFCKAVVSAWRVSLEDRHLGSSCCRDFPSSSLLRRALMCLGSGSPILGCFLQPVQMAGLSALLRRKTGRYSPLPNEGALRYRVACGHHLRWREENRVLREQRGGEMLRGAGQRKSVCLHGAAWPGLEQKRDASATAAAHDEIAGRGLGPGRRGRTHAARWT